MNYLREIQQHVSQHLKLSEPNSPLVKQASTLADRYIDGALKRLWVIDLASTGFASELTNRSGGLAGIKVLKPPFNLSEEDLVIAADHGLDVDLQVKTCRKILDSGASLILIASKNSTVYQSINPSLFLDNALEKVPCGLFDDRFCPVDTTVNITIAWCFIAEWLNACVSRGYMPVINASTFQQGGAERAALYQNDGLFHNKDTFDVEPLPSGTYCKLYLNQLSNTLDHIIFTQSSLMKKARAMHQQALDQNGVLWFKADSHLIQNQFNSVGNPDLFHYLDENLTAESVNNILSQPNIYTHLGYYTYPHIPIFFINQAGAPSIWLQGGMESNRIALNDNRVVIDQRWTFGDAVLSLPGYDIRAIPESGVIQNCLFWELNLQLLILRTNHP
ncbi:hypothetical protein [Endozoicomonas sp.]|uniref:hypothetical protein n=1 Tax=Endozoicomonas sp. TaxID=1892382 RepID=UPI002885AB45|nr:hypothetical protein [Endozoicomonas sp.]